MTSMVLRTAGRLMQIRPLTSYKIANAFREFITNDALIADLEDAVALPEKDAARRVTADFLRAARSEPNRPRLFVRVNGLTTGLTDADLDNNLDQPLRFAQRGEVAK